PTSFVPPTPRPLPPGIRFQKLDLVYLETIDW
ncbi:unnamed protein product, partial [Allacma fusca]